MFPSALAGTGQSHRQDMGWARMVFRPIRHHTTVVAILDSIRAKHKIYKPKRSKAPARPESPQRLTQSRTTPRLASLLPRLEPRAAAPPKTSQLPKLGRERCRLALGTWRVSTPVAGSEFTSARAVNYLATTSTLLFSMKAKAGYTQVIPSV